MDILGFPYGGLFLLVFIFLAVWTSEISRKLLGRDDPREVVIDEAAGLLVTLFFLPLSGFNIILGFFLFRFFDILKPFPIRTIDQTIKGGWGIVLDDLLAGVYANAMIRVVHELIGYLSL
jgi:phosphatidylglycerophosphatase A